MTKINKFLLVFRLKLPVSALITVARTSLWNPCNVTSKGKLVVQCRPSMMSWKIYALFTNVATTFIKFDQMFKNWDQVGE